MPSLLVTPYHQPGSEMLTGIASAASMGQRLAAEQEQQQQSMAIALARAAQQQQEFAAKLDFDKQQEARMQRQLDIQQSHYDAADKREADKLAMLKAEQEPFTFNGGTTATTTAAASTPATGVNLWEAGNPSRPSEGLLGKITDYGQVNDPTPDSYTRAGKSAIGNLRPDSLAVSPDVEAQLRAQGVKIGTPVTLKLDDGTSVTRFWDDRTAGQYEGKKLTGRFDLYSPEGPSPLRDRAVVGISPANSLIENFDRDPVTKEVPGASPSVMPTENTAGVAIRSMAQELANMGVTKGEAKRVMMAALPQILAKQNAATGKPVLRDFSDGTTRERDPETGNWKVLSSKDDANKPIVRNFPDGTARQYDRETGDWVVLGEKAPKDGTPQLIQRINTERGRVKDLDSELARLSKQGKEPAWPWEEDGKFYKMVDDKPKPIEKAEFEQMMKHGNSTQWAKLNDEREKRRTSLNALQSQLDSGTTMPAAPGAPAQPAAPAAQPDIKILAQKAINDPNASAAHKEAARKILGQLGAL